MGQLTATEIKNLTTPGRYVDGDGLILNVAAGGSKSWILRVRVEAALAHANSNKVEAAYRRTDCLEKRKALMADWAVYCFDG